MHARRLIGGRNSLIAAAALAAGAFAAAIATGASAAAQEGQTTLDGVFTAEQAERGADAYQQECAQCHLDDLLGDGIAPSLIGAPFHFRWSELSVGDMLVAIRTTMPQGAPASLSPRAYVDIVAFLLDANDFPAGEMELPTDQDALESIIIQEEAP